MTSGYEALSGKEKETLRLLANGHDAKSIARHLGLSVHTINERLRDARRKMEVSSSREAARLLRDTEAAGPDFHVDIDLRDVGDTERRQIDAPPQRGGAPRRFGWAATGVLTMLIAFALLTLSSLSNVMPSPVPADQTVTNVSSEWAAAQAAQRWLEMGDAADWQGGWQATGDSFRKLNTLEMWIAASRKVRVPLGAVESRMLLSEDDVPAPPSGYHMVKFRTSFAHKRDVIETVALNREAGVWKVVGVYLD